MGPRATRLRAKRLESQTGLGLTEGPPARKAQLLAMTRWCHASQCPRRPAEGRGRTEGRREFVKGLRIGFRI